METRKKILILIGIAIAVIIGFHAGAVGMVIGGQ